MSVVDDRTRHSVLLHGREPRQFRVRLPMRRRDETRQRRRIDKMRRLGRRRHWNLVRHRAGLCLCVSGFNLNGFFVEYPPIHFSYRLSRDKSGGFESGDELRLHQ